MKNKDLKIGDFVYCVSSLDNTFDAGVITDITTELNKAYQEIFGESVYWTVYHVQHRSTNRIYYDAEVFKDVPQALEAIAKIYDSLECHR
jgi:hypothetical protein